MSKHLYLSACSLLFGALVSGTAVAAEDACQTAEAEISGVSVHIVAAYSAARIDGAYEIVGQAQAQLNKGEAAAKACNCPAVADPAVKTQAMLSRVLKEKSFANAQDQLTDALATSESARQAAEDCWRKTLAAADKAAAAQEAAAADDAIQNAAPTPKAEAPAQKVPPKKR